MFYSEYSQSRQYKWKVNTEDYHNTSLRTHTPPLFLWKVYQEKLYTSKLNFGLSVVTELAIFYSLIATLAIHFLISLLTKSLGFGLTQLWVQIFRGCLVGCNWRHSLFSECTAKRFSLCDGPHYCQWGCRTRYNWSTFRHIWINSQ